jgi:hypothetical protein
MKCPICKEKEATRYILVHALQKEVIKQLGNKIQRRISIPKIKICNACFKQYGPK